jgi:hypothetical protein
MENLQQAFACACRLARDSPYRTAGAAAAVLAVTAGRLLRAQRQPTGPTRRLRASSLGSTRLLVSDAFGIDGYDAIINAAVRFDGALPPTEAVADVFMTHAAAHMRFAGVPLQARPLGEVHWTPRVLKVAHHIRERGTADEAATRRAVDAVVRTTQLADKGEPWWEVHVLREAGGGGTLLVRIHHALGDGISLVQALAPLLTDAQGTALELDHMFRQRKMGGGAPRSLLARIARPISTALDVVRCAVRGIALTAVGKDTALRFAQYMPDHDHVTVYLPTHKLATIKAIKNAAGDATTVNDVEFALFAGMVRRFELEHDGAVNIDTARMRALTPLALPEDVCEATRFSTVLRNTFTMISNDVPLRGATPAARLDASHSSWQRLKQGAAVPVAFALHRIAAQGPLALQRQTASEMQRRTSVVFSNVPGPDSPTYVAGQQVCAIHMIYPNLIPQVGILSLNGSVNVCLSMRHDKAVDLQHVLPALFAEELTAMCAAFGVTQ